MQRETKKPRGIVLYILVACAFFLMLFLVVAISIAQDIRRDKERFAESAYSVYSYLDSVVNQHLIALDGFAALVSSEDLVRENSEIGAYARFMLDKHDSIHSLGIVRKVSKRDLEGLAAEQHRLGAHEWQTKAYTASPPQWRFLDDKPVYHLLTFVESRVPQANPLLGVDLDSLPVLRDTLRRAQATDAAVVSPPFRMFGEETGYVLVRALPRPDGEVFAVLRGEASKVLPPQVLADRLISVGVYSQDNGHEEKSWLFQRKAAPADVLAELFLPRFQMLRGDGSGRQPFRLEMEKQVDWSFINWDMLVAILTGGFAVLPLLLVYASNYHSREMQRLENGNKLFYMANFDSLTGLPNRQSFIYRFEQSLAVARRQGLMHAVLFLDLDGFKGVNDYYGHQIGDKVLQRAARIFQSSVREIDTVARLGGDEFVILLHGVDGKSSAEHVASKIKRAFRQPSIDSSRSIPIIGTSIGVAIFPDDGDTVDELLNTADLHMYQDKVSRKTPSDVGAMRREAGWVDDGGSAL